LRAYSRAKQYVKQQSSYLEYDIFSLMASVLLFHYTIVIGILQVKTLEKVQIFP